VADQLPQWLWPKIWIPYIFCGAFNCLVYSWFRYVALSRAELSSRNMALCNTQRAFLFIFLACHEDVTAAEMREIDRVTMRVLGVPFSMLMGKCRGAVCRIVISRFPAVHSIGVICGKGNNGGDGFVAARKLHDAGKDVRVLLLADPSELKGDAAEMYKLLPSAIIARTPAELDKEPARSVFECKLCWMRFWGGFKPPVSGVYADAMPAECQFVDGDCCGHSFRR